MKMAPGPELVLQSYGSFFCHKNGNEKEECEFCLLEGSLFFLGGNCLVPRIEKSAILVHDWNRDCSVCYGHSRFWCMFYKYRTKLTFKALTCRNQYVYKNNKDNRQFYWLQLPDNQFYFCKKLIFQWNLIGIPDHMYILSIADTDMKHVAIFEHSLLKVYWMRT